VRANECDRGAPRNMECLVQFLNNTQHKFIIDRRSKGQFLLDCVFKHLNLIETDFFGLKYLPQESHQIQDKKAIATNIIGSASTTIDKSTVSSKAQPQASAHDHSSPSFTDLAPSTAINATSNHHNLNNDCSTSSVITCQITPNGTNSNGIVTCLNEGQAEEHQQQAANSICEDDLRLFTSVEERWLDPAKSVRKQCKIGPPFKFYFRVKFYVSDPSKLADDTTRNHLYLQLRQDILNNRLIVPTCSAILLASYILQSEVGDYKRELLEGDYISNFRLLPNQSDDMKKKVIELHKQHKSLSSADAEYQFLEHAAKKLDCYGVEFYNAKDSNKFDVQIGVSSNGIVVLKGLRIVGQFSWAKIIKILFKKRIFSIQLRRIDGENCDNFIEFNLLTNQACKLFWEECVAQHSFFRLHQPKSPPKKFFSFLNFSSKFQYSGKTEYQTMEESRKRSFSHFSRAPSKHYARRTIPIGRPSWSESTSCQDGTTHVEENKTQGHDDISKNITHDISAPISTKKPSDGRLLNGISSFESTSAYRPKSLTLKSFVFIDESKNFSTQKQSEVIPSIEGKMTSPDDQDEISATHRTCDSRNETNSNDLKRSESLRIPDSIKEAIYLTKRAGVSSGSQLAKISESLREKFMVGRPKVRISSKTTEEESLGDQIDSNNPETNSDISPNTVRLSPGRDGKYGFKIREASSKDFKLARAKKSKERCIVIYDVSPSSPAALCEPKLNEGDQIVTINGISTDGLSESKVGSLIKSIQHHKPPELVLEIIPRFDIASLESCSADVSTNISRLSPVSTSSKRPNQMQSLSSSIKDIKVSLENDDLIKEFEKLSRKKEDESHEESKLTENINKNRYQDILPYDSTRVQLVDSMTGDYINASFVDMPVPSGSVNRYIATQGPLASTCDDFWQMVWEQNCSLIIMVTPLIEAGRIKCHKYWPDEKEDIRYGQIRIRNLHEKSRTATIDRTIQMVDVKVCTTHSYPSLSLMRSLISICLFSER